MTLLDSLVQLRDAAPGLGITVDAIKKMLHRHGRRVYKDGRYLAARIEDLEWLAGHRERFAASAPRRPKGWLGYKQVKDILDLDGTAIHDLQRSGRLTSVRVGRMYFFDPESVQAVRLRRERVAPGWLSLPDLARERGWKYPTLHRAVRAMNLQTRTYHAPAGQGLGRRTRQCIRESELPAVIARMTTPASYPGRVTVAALAELTGVTPMAVRFWTAKGLPTVRDRMGALWIDLRECLTWLQGREHPAMRAPEAIVAAHLAGQDRSAA